MEIQKMLVASTGHAKACDIYFLAGDNDFPGVAFEKGEYGYFIFVGYFVDERMEEKIRAVNAFSEDFIALLAYAHGLGVQWLMLDRDGPVIEDLPVHGW